MREKYMTLALKEAIKAYKKNEIPVGAVVVKNNKIIAKAHNNRQKNHQLIGHAEILSILKAESKIKDWRLDDCDLYVTLYPCKMCELFIQEARINNTFYLIDKAENSKKMIKCERTNDCKRIENEYRNIINDFFEKLRNN